MACIRSVTNAITAAVITEFLPIMLNLKSSNNVHQLLSPQEKWNLKNTAPPHESRASYEEAHLLMLHSKDTTLWVEAIQCHCRTRSFTPYLDRPYRRSPIVRCCDKERVMIVIPAVMMTTVKTSNFREITITMRLPLPVRIECGPIHFPWIPFNEKNICCPRIHLTSRMVTTMVTMTMTTTLMNPEGQNEKRVGVRLPLARRS
jgi:hypothetical protein